MTPKTHVMLHHSLTRDSQTVSWGAIRRYHVETLGWTDIGYHVGVEQVGDGYEVFLGRDWDDVGAHCKQSGMNAKAIGLCLVGNFDLAPPPPAQWDQAVHLVRFLCRSYLSTHPLTPNEIVGRVVGHREFCDYKTCPGSQFDLAAFRAAVAS